MEFFRFLGGLAFFLYGMHVMSQSLKNLSGGKMASILERMCRTPWRGVLLGAIVTAAIQSSSATTVMVVGFVNAGMMSLTQAVGVIMGANLGTTLTAWILSLSGVSGGAPLLQLLKPEMLSPILAVIGILFILIGKGARLQALGACFAGFGILFSGMEAMSTAVEPLAQNAQFISILTLFSNPFAGVLAGALLTAVIQSSSASVGILQALTTTGAIRLGLAVPIIMGQNIGTCVTALISGLGGSKNAKRAGLLHLYFNLIGAILFLVGFYLFHAFGFFDMEKILHEADIALIHTIFNFSSVVVLLPFSKQLLHLAEISVREKSKTPALH